LHPKVEKGLERRLEMGLGKAPVDWGAAEALAFGSLLLSGTPVRFAGQDSRRGTFNQRHAVWIDQENGSEHVPLQQVSDGKSFFEIHDTPLSEAASVGFEYGFSRDYPEALVCWEAQFGDFANGAQVIFDQFMSAAEDKWGLLSGLVVLLPHGYEGQGPEHSSARLERFLQLAAEDNMQICQPTTAGQYFHLLRRQALSSWRKPLVVLTPKGMLRLASAASDRSELARGGSEASSRTTTPSTPAASWSARAESFTSSRPSGRGGKRSTSRSSPWSSSIRSPKPTSRNASPSTPGRGRSSGCRRSRPTWALLPS
jgi:2-oxoglutarate dehydrogenase E1 component